jgi:stage III sporulation protein AA
LDEEIIRIFPNCVLDEIGKYLKTSNLQEIRIKEGKPCILLFGGREVITNYLVKKEDIKYILQKASNYSLYAFEEAIKQGFITIKGGHRIGLAGECVIEDGKIKTIRNIASLNIRISREIIGCSNKIIKHLIDDDRVYNTLIISPPRCGKTTILRDIARAFSNAGRKVAVIDERSEIAACYLGVPQMELGIRTDVLDNCLKSEGMIMAIRSLSPEILICDEIGSLKDIEALIMAFNSGVNIVVTLHGYKKEDFFNRRVFSELIDNYVLDKIVILSSKNGAGTIEEIYTMPKREVTIK